MDQWARDLCLVWTCAAPDAPDWGVDADVITGRGGLSRLAAAMLTAAVGWALGVPSGEVRIERSCSRCGGRHGKPQAPGGLHVSASHTAELVAVALTQAGPVGIDLERVTAPPWEVVQRCHAAGEPRPRSAPDFYRWWTRKESVLKATGEGLYRDPLEVVVAERGPGPYLERYAGHPLVATMSDLTPGPDHVGCVTVLGRFDVELRAGPPLGDPSV